MPSDDTLLPTPPAPPSPRGEEVLADYDVLARRWVQQGWLLRAIALCKVILRLEPDHEPTRRLLSELDARGVARVPSGPAVPRPANLERDPPPSDSEPRATSASPLARLGRAEFQTMLESLELRDFAPGAVLVEEGAPGDSLFAIVEGSVEVVRTLKGGRRRTVALLGEGDFFGEMSLLSHLPRLASVKAFERTAVLELKRERLERIVQRHPHAQEVLRGYQRERLLDNVLRANALFRMVPVEQREALSHEFQLRARPAGTVLLQQGQPVDALYLLLRGQCQVVLQHAEHGEQWLRTLEEGDMFGEIALLLGLPATATVRAQTTCMLLRLDPATCEHYLLGQEGVREALSRLGNERLLHSARFLWK